MSRVPLVVLQLVVLAVGGVLLFWRADPAALRAALGAADWRVVCLAAPFVAASKLMHGVRWWLLVRRCGPVPARDAVLVLLAATGMSVLLPLRAGALLQMQVLHRRYGIERSVIAGTLVAEGLVDALLMLGLALVAVPAVGAERATLGRAALLAAPIGLAVVVLIVAGRRRERLAHLLPRQAGAWLTRILEGLAGGLAGLGRPAAILLLLPTVGDWLLASTGSWLVGEAFSVGVPPPTYVAVEITGNLAGAIPLSQGNIGAYEVAVQQTLVLAGAGRSSAAAFAIANHATIIVAETLTGAVAFWLLRLRWRDLFYLRTAGGGGSGAERSGTSVGAR